MAAVLTASTNASNSRVSPVTAGTTTGAPVVNRYPASLAGFRPSAFSAPSATAERASPSITGTSFPSVTVNVVTPAIAAGAISIEAVLWVTVTGPLRMGSA